MNPLFTVGEHHSDSMSREGTSKEEETRRTALDKEAGREMRENERKRIRNANDTKGIRVLSFFSLPSLPSCAILSSSSSLAFAACSDRKSCE
jgi:hypothetical protein